MKKTVILILTICFLLFSAAMALTACLPSDNNDNKNTETEETQDNVEQTERYEWFPGENLYEAPETYEGITKEQEEQIKELRKNGKYGDTGYYVYGEMVIIGKVDPDVPKLDWKTAKSIILNNDDVFDIIDKFREIQYYPDFVCQGGNGYSVYFWSDVSGEKESIYIVKRCIAYNIFDDEGNSIYHEEYYR